MTCFANAVIDKRYQKVIDKWESLDYGMFIHFGSKTFSGKGAVTPKKLVTPEVYAPTDLNVKQWIGVAKKAGMQYAVLVVKHADGFCLWDSEASNYDVAASPVKTDVLKEFVKACRMAGIKAGVHYLVPDANIEGSVKVSDAVSNEYFALIKKHTTEIHTKYPGIFFHDFNDRRLSPTQCRQLYDLIRKLNPNCIIITNRYEAVEKDMYFPKRHYTTLNREWFWVPNPRLRSPETLYKYYLKARKAKASFLLNVGPDTTGKIPREFVEELGKLKKLIDTKNKDKNNLPK